MSLTVKTDNNNTYEESLKSQKPTIINQQVVKPPKGSMSAPITIPPLVIPPLNTNINYTFVEPAKTHKHPDLYDISTVKLPEEFNWHEPFDTDTEEIKQKKRLMSPIGNQMLCGSCWAISTASLLSDNFVISGIVDWMPMLSTTWSLMCYPQHKCQGGNPAILLSQIAKGGIVSENCADYSWCATNKYCNGDAKKHMEQQEIDLSTLIPEGCACYMKGKHYLYKIDDDIKSVYIGSPGVTEKNITTMIKKQVYTKGPVVGSFLVFKNFKSGKFTHMNGGVYLEQGNYEDAENEDNLSFSKEQVSGENYMGSHAISIIGWGIAKNIKTQKGNTDVPYWYCKNSWTDKWGNEGYFKMAMYPWNQMSVFEKRVLLNIGLNSIMAGGIIIPSVSQRPEEQTFEQIKDLNFKLLHDDDYYTKDILNKTGNDYGGKNNLSDKNIFKYIFIIIIVLAICIILYTLIIYIAPKLGNIFNKISRSSKSGRYGRY